ncbi:trypsin-like serine peptidase [Dermatophilus congolensis]|uniref:trypsin-like serine peptidase n=1 Tax=Dermatophilus congolensis TaxID=1863 RepID=UPI001AAECE0E|nr:trypsin-like peptidase domain-containing protein [Dermatophilus congolensis]MBO3130077.1 trypsin-like peptidase domain-containing protein [Dermatophilus congolensis]MBO3131296.1 trypsin-like peptidase domain-containing protein [Dermatophilus congolensis]MBO3134548.1 trypsin-like peptidase domain-containing protein [Dermatophilus congolensis]MBO3136785.1 trypsin-like peptidase domain-containing protein [Dermatophilus congolensis]MBO3139029.1 trypsin-like peptidase domain-containing protein [
MSLRSSVLAAVSGILLTLCSAGGVGAIEFSNNATPLTPEQSLWHGLVRLPGGCSGSVVRLSDVDKSSSALVVTNGHCMPDRPGVGEVITNESPRVEMKLVTPQGDKPLTPKATVLATLTGTDVQVVSLQETYLELENKYGTYGKSWSIKKENENSVNSKIFIISGYWREYVNCSLADGGVRLREGEYSFKNATRYSSGCSTRGGYSGSPVVDSRTQELVAIHSTGVDFSRSKKEDCEEGRPCELREGKPFVVEGAKYGQDLAPVAACITNNTADLRRQGCNLNKIGRNK